MISDHPPALSVGKWRARAASVKAGAAELILILLLGMAMSASAPNFWPHKGKVYFIIQVTDYQEDREIFHDIWGHVQ